MSWQLSIRPWKEMGNHVKKEVTPMFYTLLSTLLCDESEHCLISYRGGLGTSLCIMGCGTQHPQPERVYQTLQHPQVWC